MKISTLEGGGRNLGKLEADAEVGVKDEKQGSGKIGAGVNLGLETDALGDIKEATGDTFDNLKTGFKVARKKLSQVYDKQGIRICRYAWRENLITRINDDNEIMKQPKGNKQYCPIYYDVQ